MDFAKHGASLRGLNLLTAFFNANIQGFEKMARELNPLKKDYTRTAGVYLRASMLTAAAIALWYANKDDEEIRAITAEELGVYAFFRVPGLGLRKVALPHELGVLFFTIPYLIMDHSTGRRRDSLGRAIRKALSTGPFQAERMMPNLFKVPAEMMLGRSLFWNKDIVPEYNRKKKGWEQVDSFTRPGTQWLCKKIFDVTGGAIELSAAKMEYFVRNVTGYMGNSFLNSLSTALEQFGVVKGPADWKALAMDWSGLQRFIKQPYTRSRYSDMYWDKYKRAESWHETIQGYIKSGRGQQVTDTYKWIGEHEPDIKTMVYGFRAFSAANRSLSAIYTRMRGIQQSNLTYDQKQALLLPLKKGLNSYYKSMVEKVK